MENEMVEQAKTVMGTHKRLVSKAPPYVPSCNDPREELRRLVKQHKALTKASTAVTNMSSDRKIRDKITGKVVKVIECRLPSDVQIEFQALAKDVAKKKAQSLETAMLQQLRQIPIYNAWLKDVWGVGPVVAAYLVSEIDIRRVSPTGKVLKPSSLRQFCGLAVIDGRLQRHTSGKKSNFSGEIRTRLYQMFSSMWKNRVEARNKEGKVIREGQTSKYLDIWVNARHRKLQQAVDGRINNGEREVSAKGYAFSYGWHKAADVFVEDLYVVWRALEGLEVWPSYYAAKLGYEHGGKIAVNAPKFLTLEEALRVVGDVSARPHAWGEVQVEAELPEEKEIE